MKRLFLTLPAAVLLGACAGETHTSEQSPQQPSRYVENTRAGDRAAATRRGTLFTRNRIYLITRLETSDTPRGEWRALGETIKQNGSSISFTEMGSGRTVAFVSPHQITATSSFGDRGPSQLNSEIPNPETSPGAETR